MACGHQETIVYFFGSLILELRISSSAFPATFLGKQSIARVLIVFLNELWCLPYVRGQGNRHGFDFKKNSSILKGWNYVNVVICLLYSMCCINLYYLLSSLGERKLGMVFDVWYYSTLVLLKLFILVDKENQSQIYLLEAFCYNCWYCSFLAVT